MSLVNVEPKPQSAEIVIYWSDCQQTVRWICMRVLGERDTVFRCSVWGMNISQRPSLCRVSSWLMRGACSVFVRDSTRCPYGLYFINQSWKNMEILGNSKGLENCVWTTESPYCFCLSIFFFMEVHRTVWGKVNFLTLWSRINIYIYIYIYIYIFYYILLVEWINEHGVFYQIYSLKS